MRALLAAFLLSFFFADNAVAACGGKLAGFNAVETESGSVHFKTVPSTPAVTEPFSILFEICNKDGSTFTGDLSANAHMPMHRHGMNYKPTITKQAGGLFQADGFVFHMPGHWQFIFDLHHDGSNEQVKVDYPLK